MRQAELVEFVAALIVNRCTGFESLPPGRVDEVDPQLTKQADVGQAFRLSASVDAQAGME